MNKKYTDEEFKEAIKNSYTIREVATKLSVKSLPALYNKARKLDVDYSHFRSSRANFCRKGHEYSIVGKIKYGIRCNECGKEYEIKRHLKRNYNLDYDPRIDTKCSICGNGKDNNRIMVIDHDHSTNELRNVLCHQCNLLLGMTNDNIKILQSAIKYLKKYRKEK